MSADLRWLFPLLGLGACATGTGIRTDFGPTRDRLSDDGAVTVTPSPRAQGPGESTPMVEEGIQDSAQRPGEWFRVDTAKSLEEGAFRTTFGFSMHENSGSMLTRVGYGVLDNLQLDLTLATGDQPETLHEAEDPSLMFGFGLQTELMRTDGWLVAARLETLLSKDRSFELAPDDGNPFTDDEEGNSSKVSFQPSLLATTRLGSFEVFGQGGVRLGDSTEFAFHLGGGVAVPVGVVSVVAEVDYVQQILDYQGAPDDPQEGYATLGIVFWPRKRLEVHLGPSFGLTEDSNDWSVHASMAVRF